MHRLWIITALAWALTVPYASAQRRGGGSFGGAHFGGGVHAGGSFSHAPTMSHGPIFTSAPHNNGVHFRTSFGHGFHHHGFHRFPWLYGYGYPYYPYYGYDPWLWGSASSDDYADQYYQQNQQLSQQVNDLSNEVSRLREEQDARAYPPPVSQAPPAPAPSKSEPAPATVLVFQDKHREEIQNYAVVGHTLWVFSEQRARKIPLAQLDLPATAKVNDDRGVDFNIPR